MDIVFAKTRWHYDSYIDFWKLVELSGFPTIYVDEVDVSQPYVVITSPLNGEWRPHIDNQKNKVRRAHLIHWCLERPSGAGGIGNFTMSHERARAERHFDEVWCSDRRLAAESNTRFVVLGSDYGLGNPSLVGDRIYDYCHMSYVNPRRNHIYSQHRGPIAPNCWPPERDGVMRGSRFALNVHQDSYPFQEPLRFALFAAYGLPILTETIYDAFPWNAETMIFNTYEGMEGRLLQMLSNDYSRWYDFGASARDHMCNTYRFGKMVREAVEDSTKDRR